MNNGVRHPIVELRQYTLHDGMRDVLVDLFEREFVEPQEAAGMAVVGQFHDLDDPNRFVWLRGFPDPDRRAEALHRFYGGPVWRQHRDRANATMVDSDDVLLLRPVHPDGDFPAPAAVRPPVGEHARPESVVLATLWHRTIPVDRAFVDHFRREVRPVLVEAGGTPLACLQTEYAENTYPALPVRDDVHVFAWFARFTDPARLLDHRRRLAGSRRWQEEVLPGLAAWSVSDTRRLRLAPTARSELR
jgi:hypothetical protein